MTPTFFSKNRIHAALALAAILLVCFPNCLHADPVRQLGKMKAERDIGGILEVSMNSAPLSAYPAKVAKAILVKSEYSGFGKFYLAALGFLFTNAQITGFLNSVLLFWLLFMALRFLAWTTGRKSIIPSLIYFDSDAKFLGGIMTNKSGVLIFSAIMVFFVQFLYVLFSGSFHLAGWNILKPIGLSGVWIGMIPLYIFMILPGMTPSAFFCGWIALLAAGSVHFMGVWSFTSAYAGMVFAGLTPFFLFSLLFLASFLFKPTSPRSKWRKAKTDGHRYLCGHCYGRFVLGPGLPRFVRNFGRMFAREIPLKHKDFRDYFVCPKCGSGQKKFEDVRFVTAVIDAQWKKPFQKTECAHGGVHLRVNAVNGRKTWEVDADLLEIRNAPGLDYDFLVQDFYLGLTKNPGSRAKMEAGQIPVILVDDPPLSTNVRRLIEEWFEEIRTVNSQPCGVGEIGH